jgi:acyl-CoA reductase-like NAD-dependent aldehyde dehydrogenase
MIWPMTDGFVTVTPVDGSAYAERRYASAQEVDRLLGLAAQAQKDWCRVSVADRAVYLGRMVDAFKANAGEIVEQLAWQMGRPVTQGPGEIRGFEERARYMISIAERCLQDLNLEEKTGFRRFIRKVPLGVVFTIAPWNYPYLTAVNSIVPALMAGNAVVLKHSSQTPLCAESLDRAFQKAGLPEGVFQIIHASHAQAESMIRDARVQFVAFTGSVPGGRAIQRAAADRFMGRGLELGGKDPAYVCADANLDHAITNLVDGAFFNSGQSCCGIERIYVEESVFKPFVEGAVELTGKYVLGSPLENETTLGPMVRTEAADLVRQQIAEAVQAGAKPLVDPSLFPLARDGTPYLAPQILIDVNHGMRVMTEESFGPVVGIMAVKSDQEAIRLMNDSPFGLTAAVWTEDQARAVAIGDQIETGTWFMNRCDYLDPGLAWTGVKESGFGCTLSELGYQYLTRPKSFHLRLATT